MRNPYADTDWEQATHLHSATHTHTFPTDHDADDFPLSDDPTGQEDFESIYNSGIRHFAVANYRPSRPTYPLMKYFDPVPEDALGCPNAEHFGREVGGHYCGIGSMLDSGHGYDGSWQELFDDIFDELVYEGGGGIAINHPKRTTTDRKELLKRLDYDDRVLGIEAYNHRSEMRPKYNQTGNAIDIWDEVLQTGRHVLGFFAPDFHASWARETENARPIPEWTDEVWGRNILLVEDYTEEAAARAYRDGRFYGAFRGSGLAFEHISVDDGVISVETNGATKLEIIADGNVGKRVEATSTTFDLDDVDTYLRIEAHDDTGERIFSQPITFN